MTKNLKKIFTGGLLALSLIFISSAAMAASVPAKTVGTDVKMRKAPSTSSTIVAKLTNSKVTVIDNSNNWYKISFNNKTGWVNGSYIKLSTASGVINANGVNFRKSTSTKGKAISSLKKNTAVQILGITKGWNKVKIGSKVGYVASKFVNIKTSSAKTSRSDNAVTLKAQDDNSINSKVVTYAKELTGISYVYGGTNPKVGFDCSGFIGYVYKKFGIKLNRSAQDMYSNGVRVSKSSLKAGDILFFDASRRKNSGEIDHAGIYLGGDTFIHASSSNGEVRIQKLSEYRGTYIGAKRVI